MIYVCVVSHVYFRNKLLNARHSKPAEANNEAILTMKSTPKWKKKIKCANTFIFVKNDFVTSTAQTSSDSKKIRPYGCSILQLVKYIDIVQCHVKAYVLYSE